MEHTSYSMYRNYIDQAMNQSCSIIHRAAPEVAAWSTCTGGVTPMEVSMDKSMGKYRKNHRK